MIQQRAFEEEDRRCGTREIPPLQEPVEAIREQHIRSRLALVNGEINVIPAFLALLSPHAPLARQDSRPPSEPAISGVGANRLWLPTDCGSD